MKNAKLAALLLIVLTLSACTRNQTSIQFSVDNGDPDSLCTGGVQATLTFEGEVVESPIVTGIEGWTGPSSGPLLRAGGQQLNLTARCITEDGEGFIRLQRTTEPESGYLLPLVVRVNPSLASGVCSEEPESENVIEVVEPAPCTSGF